MLNTAGAAQVLGKRTWKDRNRCESQTVIGVGGLLEKSNFDGNGMSRTRLTI